jgi:hypothetical protein
MTLAGPPHGPIERVNRNELWLQTRRRIGVSKLTFAPLREEKRIPHLCPAKNPSAMPGKSAYCPRITANNATFSVCTEHRIGEFVAGY